MKMLANSPKWWQVRLRGRLNTVAGVEERLADGAHAYIVHNDVPIREREAELT